MVYVVQSEVCFIKHNTKRQLLFGIILFVFLFFLFIPLKIPLFNDSYSTVLKDRNGSLLGAYISDDEQWRFPPIKKVSYKFKKCIILFEDNYFYFHPGINPISIIRAAYQNIKEKEIVSGASTLTMQVIRLSRKGKERSFSEKIIEALLHKLPILAVKVVIRKPQVPIKAILDHVEIEIYREKE